jgi:hypothetical protein
MGGEISAPERNIDKDAPQGMRQEILDAAFSIAEHNSDARLTTDLIYRVVSQTLGIAPSGNPYGGFRYAAARDLSRAPWPRVYDIILRLAREFDQEWYAEFQQGINEALAGNGVVWDLSDDRRLVRVLPLPAQQQVSAALQELSASRFAPALRLFAAAMDAYDDRPRRDRDACSNAFDALESVAKEKQQMPNVTFGHVVAQVQTLNPQVVGVLKSLNTLRNSNFGHGMTVPFGFTGPEVDFTYLTCVAGILLFSRMP